MSLPDLADALPGAERALARAVAAARAGGDTPVQPHLVTLLEAAGGPDVGNAVRAHLERRGLGTAGRPPGVVGTPEALLEAAHALHRAASQDLRASLHACGLTDDLPPQDRRRPRAEHAATALAARDAAVVAVLERLRAG